MAIAVVADERDVLDQAGLFGRLDGEEVAVWKDRLEGLDFRHDERWLPPRQVADHVGDEYAAGGKPVLRKRKELLRREMRRDGKV